MSGRAVDGTGDPGLGEVLFVLTPIGRRALEQARRWQEQVFDELTAGWTGRRRDDFRRAMTDLLGRSDEMS